MTEQKPANCIYCRASAGSAEHTILAALGGLRTDRGIVCGPCNNGFGETIDRALADDMKSINAVVGVMNGRTRKPIAATVEDAATGRTFLLTGGRRLDHPDAVVVSESTQAGVRSLYALASTQKQADDFVHRLRQEGRPVTVTAREVVPLLFASTPTVQWNFGGTDTFRCVARLVVNLLASYRPALARESWLTPLKTFIRHGGDHESWVAYSYGGQWATPTRFDFAHRFALVFDAEAGEVYAQVSLLGIIELVVRLGKTTLSRSETWIYEMDVLAHSPPSDIAVTTSEGVMVARPASPTLDPSLFVPDRLAQVLVRRIGRLWDDDAPKLLASLNAARLVEPFARHDAIVEALAGQQQRLLNIASFVASDIGRHLTEMFGVAVGSSIDDAFRVLAQSDAASRTGVTDLTRAHAEMLRYVMADHLLEVLNEREIRGDELRLLLEGGTGAAIIGRYMMEQVQHAHPFFRGDK